MRNFLRFMGFVSLPFFAAVASPPIQSIPDYPAADAREAAYRERLYNDIKVAIGSRDFTALNSLERGLIKTPVRSQSGDWNLQTFHLALNAVLQEGMNAKSGCQIRRQGFTQDWMRATPTSPAAFIAHAELKIAEGWCYRGEAVASKVKAEDWPKFHLGVQQAYETLIGAKRIASSDPQYYATLLFVLNAAGASRSEFDRTFDEAVLHEPYYYPIYRSASNYFLPQWHGNDLLYEKFARRAASLTPKDGDRLYAEVAYWNVLYPDIDVISRGFDWNRVKKGSHDLLSRFPSRQNVEFFAEAACKLGDIEAGRQFIRDRFRGQPDTSLVVWFAGCDRMASRAVAQRKARDERSIQQTASD